MENSFFDVTNRLNTSVKKVRTITNGQLFCDGFGRYDEYFFFICHLETQRFFIHISVYLKRNRNWIYTIITSFNIYGIFAHTLAVHTKHSVCYIAAAAAGVKVRQSQNVFFKPIFLPKNKRIEFTTMIPQVDFFGGNRRPQETILKLADL